MSDWIALEAASEVPENGAITIEADGLSVLLVKHQGCIHALENRCSHDGSEMGGGRLDNGHWVCPHHGAQFDLDSGAALCPPAYEPVKVFPTKLENGVVLIKDDRW